MAQSLRVEVVASFPHDTTAFTEGLVYDSGVLYESAGLYGSSTVRMVDPASGKVLKSVSLPKEDFGEGLALVGDHFIQLTWREHVAFVRDRDTLAEKGRLSFSLEGWGLCYDGKQLVESDGSSSLSLLDPDTLAVQARLPVTLEGEPVKELNELECVNGSVYANVWHTDLIMRIDEATGRVAAVIDASGLLTQPQRDAAGPEGVLNGIAFNPQHGTFYITGKQWPLLFEVKFVLAQQ